MKTYKTIQGDTWDSISYIALGSTEHSDKIMNANLEYIDTFIFPAGVTLFIPEVSNTTSAQSVPWRQ